MSSNETNEIKALLHNDPKGLRQIYADYLPRIKKLITSNGGNFDDTQDIFQDALIIIYEKAKAKDFQLTSGFYTLLYGICRNLWGNRLQKKSFKEVTLPDDIKYTTSENIEKDIFHAEKAKLFAIAFQQLGADCQKLMRLFFDKIKMEKITTMMGFSSLNYTKKRKFQCKEKLVKIIKSDVRFQELIN